MGKLIRRYIHRIIPTILIILVVMQFVLIGLGVFLLFKSGNTGGFVICGIAAAALVVVNMIIMQVYEP